ncbi:uncharacterized protein [Misgurnus anguillicaudatus]
MANQRRLSKNTQCGAKMVCTLVNTVDARGASSRSKDPHIPTYPTSVRLYNVHNHNIFVAEALRHRDVGAKAIETLTQLFEIGHNPTSALAVLKSDLLAEHGNKYVYASANRTLCPDLQFCYRLYQKVNKQEFGEQSGEGMLVALERQVESYNASCDDTCAKLRMSSAGTPLVAICSPLMKRTHSLSNSGEMCFMDSSGNMDRENCRVFLLLTHTCAGGLPLGIIITQSEDERTISEGLELLKSLLKNDSFGGRGEAGPCVFLTDYSKAEKGAIAQVFPEAKQLLCIFHLLQAVWRSLWNKEHKVEMKDRQTLFSIVKDMLYAREMSTVELLYQQALDNPLTTRNKKFLTYLQSLYSRRESWALSYRRDLPTRGNQTNNYVEAAMRVLKDKILQRTKAFNLPQLFNLFTTRLEMYYEARVTDIALGHWEAFHRSRFLATESNIKPSDISQMMLSDYLQIYCDGVKILTLCSAPVWRGCFVSVGLRVSVGLCIVVDVFVWMFPCSAWIAPLLTTPPTPHSIPSSPTSTVVYATIAINPGPCYFRIDFAFSLFVYIFNKHCHISPAFASTHFVSLQKNLANMEAAGDQPTATLEDKVIEDMQKAVHAMVAKVSELSQRSPHTTLPTAPPTPPAPSSPPGGSFCPEPRLPIPEKYSGEPNYCRTFLSHCSLHFAQQPRSFFLEETKVAFTLSLLTGKAAVWGTAVWENKDICCSSFSLLSEEMKRVFDRSVVGKEAARLLTELRQGERSVSDYAIEFRTLAAECRWNEEAQWDHFLHGLADRIQREIVTAELPTSLNGLVDLVIRVDARLSMAARRKSSTTSQQRSELFNLPSEVSTGVLSDLEPMQVGRARLSPEERNRRRSQGLCMYCGEPGHQCHRCPVKDQAR